MKLNIELRSPGAEMPEYATEGAVAFDLRTVEDGHVPAHGSHTFNTGIAVAVPEGYGLFVFSRSGHGFKHGLRLANCTGVIDQDYRGTIHVRVTNDTAMPFDFDAGDRIAQAALLPIARADFVISKDLTQTDRGIRGFGSTGDK